MHYTKIARAINGLHPKFSRSPQLCLLLWLCGDGKMDQQSIVWQWWRIKKKKKWIRRVFLRTTFLNASLIYLDKTIIRRMIHLQNTRTMQFCSSSCLIFQFVLMIVVCARWWTVIKNINPNRYFISVSIAIEIKFSIFYIIILLFNRFETDKSPPKFSWNVFLCEEIVFVFVTHAAYEQNDTVARIYQDTQHTHTQHIHMRKQFTNNSFSSRVRLQAGGFI